MTRRLFFLFLGCICGFTATPVYGEGFRGGQFFAMLSPRFPCERALTIVNAARFPAVAVLWGTFGDDVSCVRSFMEMNRHRPHLVEIHFSNESCRRKGRCLEGEFFPKLSVPDYNHALKSGALIPDIDSRVMAIRRAIEPWMNDFTFLALSTGLEDNFSPGTFQAAYTQIRAAWPWTIIRSTVFRVAKIDGYSGLLETHIVDLGIKAPCVFGEDGNRLSDEQSRILLKKHKSCAAYFLWWRSWQNTEADENRFIAPRLRSFEIRASTIRPLQQILKGR